MAAQKEFPMEFPKCPHCGSTDTVAKVAFAKEKIGKDTLPQLGVKISPMIKMGGIATPTFPCVMRFEDTCANCGMDRTVRATIQTMPADQVMAMMGVKMPQIKT